MSENIINEIKEGAYCGTGGGKLSDNSADDLDSNGQDTSDQQESAGIKTPSGGGKSRRAESGGMTGMPERRLVNIKGFLYLTEFLSGISVMAAELGSSRLLSPYFSSSQIVWTIIKRRFYSDRFKHDSKPARTPSAMCAWRTKGADRVII